MKLIIFRKLNFQKWQSFQKGTTQEMKFSFKDFFSKSDQIPRKLRIWSHLLKKSSMEKLHFLCSERKEVDHAIDLQLTSFPMH